MNSIPSRLLNIHQWWEPDGRGAVITVRIARITIKVVIADRSQPIALDETDKALMKLAREAMIRMGVRARRLRRQDAQYAIWAVAQHIKASVGSMAESLDFGGIPLQRDPLRLPAASILVEPRL